MRATLHGRLSASAAFSPRRRPGLPPLRRGASFASTRLSLPCLPFFSSGASLRGRRGRPPLRRGASLSSTSLYRSSLLPLPASSRLLSFPPRRLRQRSRLPPRPSWTASSRVWDARPPSRPAQHEWPSMSGAACKWLKHAIICKGGRKDSAHLPLKAVQHQHGPGDRDEQA